MRHVISAAYLSYQEDLIDIGGLYTKHHLDPAAINVTFCEPMGYGDGTRILFRTAAGQEYELEIGCKGNRQPDPNNVQAWLADACPGEYVGMALFDQHRDFFFAIFALVMGGYDDD